MKGTTLTIACQSVRTGTTSRDTVPAKLDETEHEHCPGRNDLDTCVR